MEEAKNTLKDLTDAMDAMDDQRVAQDILIEMYPLTKPGAAMSFTKFSKHCAEMYASFALKDQYTYPQYLDEMLKRFRYQAAIYS
jgi:hypothetical protein